MRKVNSSIEATDANAHPLSDEEAVFIALVTKS